MNSFMTNAAQSNFRDFYYEQESWATTGKIIIRITLEESHCRPQSVLEATINTDLSLDAKSQLEHLKTNVGFNVSQLAIMLKVKRPTVYDWLEGKNNRHSNQKRLDEIFSLFKDWQDLRIGSYFHKKIIEEKSLYDFLSEENINLKLIKKYVNDVKLTLIRNKKNAENKQKILENSGFKPLSHEELSKRADLFLCKIS